MELWALVPGEARELEAVAAVDDKCAVEVDEAKVKRDLEGKDMSEE